MLTDAELDRHLDAVLRAAGSALRHYTLHKSREDMRAAMRRVVAAAQGACAYPDCACPFDAPADPTWCARGLPRGTATAGQGGGARCAPDQDVRNDLQSTAGADTAQREDILAAPTLDDPPQWLPPSMFDEWDKTMAARAAGSTT